VKNSLGVILVSPFKILKQVTKSIFTRLRPIPNLTLRAAFALRKVNVAYLGVS